SLRDNQLPLAVPADCHEYIKSRLTLLASRLEEVNAMALAGNAVNLLMTILICSHSILVTSG
ncbi:hypothetical protein, partial [Klebsiella pneumoniae]